MPAPQLFKPAEASHNAQLMEQYNEHVELCFNCFKTYCTVQFILQYFYEDFKHIHLEYYKFLKADVGDRLVT